MEISYMRGNIKDLWARVAVRVRRHPMTRPHRSLNLPQKKEGEEGSCVLPLVRMGIYQNSVLQGLVTTLP